MERIFARKRVGDDLDRFADLVSLVALVRLVELGGRKDGEAELQEDGARERERPADSRDNCQESIAAGALPGRADPNRIRAKRRKILSALTPRALNEEASVEGLEKPADSRDNCQESIAAGALPGRADPNRIRAKRRKILSALTPRAHNEEASVEG